MCMHMSHVKKENMYTSHVKNTRATRDNLFAFTLYRTLIVKRIHNTRVQL